MKKFIALPTKEKRLRMNGKIMTLDFLRALYSVHNEIGQLFFHTYSVTCLNKSLYHFC